MIAAARDAGADTFITGEGAHHTFFDAEEWGLNVIYAGHYATETVGVRALAEHLTVYVSSNDRALLVSRLVNGERRRGESTLSPDQFEEAVPLLERAVAVWEASLGPDHPQTAIGLNNLALVLAQCDRAAEAQTALERAAAISEKTLGPEHPQFAKVLSNLGGFQRMAGDLEASRANLQRSLGILEQLKQRLHTDKAPMVLGRSYAAFDSYPGMEVAHDLALMGFDPQYVLVGHAGKNSADVQLVEAVVPAASSLIGTTLAEADLRASTGLNVMAISRTGGSGHGC